MKTATDRVEQYLREDLATRDERSIGTPFYSEAALMELCAPVARMTVRNAVRRLVDDGMLVTRQGANTIIRRLTPREQPPPFLGDLRRLTDDELFDLEDRLRGEVRDRLAALGAVI